MNYIYDILVNFNDGDRLIEFFEWNETDLFEHIKKIPIYRISSKQMQEICNNKICLLQNWEPFPEKSIMLNISPADSTLHMFPDFWTIPVLDLG